MVSPMQQRIAIVGTLARTIIGFRGDLICTLVANGYQVFAFASDYSESTEQQVKALGATPISYKISQFGLNPFAEIRTTIELYQLFKKHGITISFCYFIKPVIYGTLAAWLAKVPVRIAKIEGLGRTFVEPIGGMTSKGRLVKWIQLKLLRVSLPKAQLVLFLNPEDRHDLLNSYQIPILRHELINGIGVHLDRYPQQPPPSAPLRFIFVGRLLNEKGIRYFLSAAAKIKLLHPATEFVVLGEPDDAKVAVTRAELSALVAKGTVIYPGVVQDVAAWLRDSSVFVLPSYYREGVPRSTQEALAVGRAVITTDMPGCRQTVQDGFNGFLIPPHDQSALEAAMLQFIVNPELITVMGENSRELAVKCFDVMEINANILRYLQEIGLQ